MLPLNEKINHIAEEADSADKDDWIPDRIHSKQQKIHSLATNNKNGPSFYTVTLLVNNRPIKFIINTGSPVTLIPKSKFNEGTTLKPITVDYRDVNDNKMKYEGRTTTNIGRYKESAGFFDNNQNTHSLLGLD